MVSVRLLSILLFFIISASFSITKSYRESNRGKGVSNGKEILEGVHVESGAAQIRFHGRKILQDNVMSAEEVLRPKVGSSLLKSELISKAGTKCEECLNLEDQEKSGRILLSEDVVDVSGFVAFNADYRGPRQHPPKNN